MATQAEILAELEALGSEQTRKTYRRHGVGENQYGVSYAKLAKLHKRIKHDHELARQLWATGNHDARILATMIADPKQADRALLETWGQELENYVQADGLAGYIGKTSLARELMEQWTRSPDERIGTVGWGLLATLAIQDKALSDDYFAGYLGSIARDIHGSPNRVRHAMNNALIAIGMRGPALEAQALAATQRIGAVRVDHGQTNCQTPDAAAYIRKANTRKQSA